MKINLLVTVLSFLVLLLVIILSLLRKDKISVKYAIMWILTIIISSITLVIPGSLKLMSSILGFELESNMVLCLFIVILLLITIALTVMITKQRKDITILIQEIGILKKENKKDK